MHFFLLYFLINLCKYSFINYCQQICAISLWFVYQYCSRMFSAYCRTNCYHIVLHRRVSFLGQSAAVPLLPGAFFDCAVRGSYSVPLPCGASAQSCRACGPCSLRTQTAPQIIRTDRTAMYVGDRFVPIL